MSAVSPVAVEVRSSVAAEARPVTHRTKHRKEVKRYHQRQLNKQLREEAKTRDAQLFLFDTKATATAAEKEGDANSALAESGKPAKQQQSLKQKNATKAIAYKGEVAAAATELSMASPARSPQPKVSRVVGAPLLPLAHSSWGFDFVLRKASCGVGAAVEAAVGAQEEEEEDGREPAHGAHGAEMTMALQPSPMRSVVASPLPAPVAQSRPPTSLVAAPHRPAGDLRAAPHDTANGSDARNGSDNRPSGDSNCISALPIDSAAAPASAKLLNNAQVQRVEGVAAIPMEVPLSAGTDLNRPPRNYLTLDPLFNVHQHAPGFVRDQRVALQHMLATAMANWKDLHQNALIVTSAEAMRTIFEQVYVPSRPLALRVRRIGPTIVIDSRATQPSEARELRQQALFSKALYLMKETHGRNVAAEESAAAAQMTLALPERRLCSVSASSATRFGVNLHRYSQLLRWRIDTTELLVGNDAPVVLDQGTGMEQLVRVKAADQPDSIDSEQRETLRCWFDAMLANVPNVGTYYHCDGTLLSYQVKKTNELLGYLEARTAGAALNFTSTTLQWIVKHCTRDGGTYAVFRDYTMDYLKLYEIPGMDETSAFVAETERHFSPTPLPSNTAGEAGDSPVNTTNSSSINGDADTGAYAGYPRDAPHLSRFGLNFGRTCFNIGQHLYLEGGVNRANDALALLHRSLGVFLPCCGTEAVARESVMKVMEMLPALVSRKLRADASSTAAAAAPSSSPTNNSNNNQHSHINGNSSGACTPFHCETTPAGFVTASCSSPELYRDGLVLCGRFEVPIRSAFLEAGRSEGNALVQAFHARCLVACSAAVCTVVATSLDAYYTGCHHLRVMRKARSEAKARDGKATALRGVDFREDVMTSLASMIQDLLQVVVEGLVRLEETSALISPLHAAEATSTMTTANAPTGAAAAAAAIAPNAANAWAVSTSTPLLSTAAAATTRAPAATPTGAAASVGSTHNAKEELSSAGHSSSSAASESAVSIASSVHEEGTNRPKRTSSPARVAVAAAQHGGLLIDDTLRATSCGTVLDPRTQVNTTPLRSALCELYGDVVMVAMADTASGFTTRVLAELGTRMEARAQEVSQRLPTTLQWLTSLKADVVSLSFTALRFYGRVASHTRRHLVKLAQVYYLVGKEHHRTARYTKALEALHRAKSLLQAAHKAPADLVFGDAFGTHGMMQWADVMRLLGDVYRSVVERKLETALGVAAVTVAQPLLVGPLHNLPEEADTFFMQALSAYKQGGGDEGCASARACTLLLYASVMMERIAISGQPASHADSQRIADLIRDSDTLAPMEFMEEREWQWMRLFTITLPTAVDAALTRVVADVLLRKACWARTAQEMGDCGSCSSGAWGGKKDVLWVDADVVDVGGPRRERLVVPPQCVMIEAAQKALVCCVMVEHLVSGRATEKGKGGAALMSSENKYRNMLRWVGKAAAFITSCVETFLRSKDVWRNAAVRHQWMSTMRTWGEHTVGGCLHHMVCLIVLRLLRAAQAHVPPQKQQEARETFKAVTSRLEKAESAASESEAAYEDIVQSLSELKTLLTPYVNW